MKLIDVNALIYAYREEFPYHEVCLRLLEDILNRGERFAMMDMILVGFLRIATNSKIFKNPSPIDQTIRFSNSFRNHPSCVMLHPDASHWECFTQLCATVEANGNLITDTYLAAMAIEHDCEFVSMDNDFARFPGLNWSRPTT